MSVRTIARAALCAALAVPAVALLAADAKPSATKPKPATTKPAATRPAEVAKDNWTAPMDYGPFLMTSVARPGGKPYKTTVYAKPDAPKFPVDSVPDMIANKGIVMGTYAKEVVDGRDAPSGAVCFDIDRCATVADWDGGWLDLSGTMLTQHKGIGQVTLAGRERWHVDGPAWGSGPNGDDFTRPPGGTDGKASADRTRFLGIYANNILSYRVGGREVLEAMSARTVNAGRRVPTRVFEVRGPAERLTMAVCDVSDGQPLPTNVPNVVAIRRGDTVTAAGLLAGRPPADMALVAEAGHIRLKNPSGNFELVVLSGDATVIDDVAAIATAPQRAAPLEHYMQGRPARWKPITVAGKVGSAPTKKDADPAFAVDEITLPSTNYYNSWFRLSGLDFFPDGRAAVCTLNGDVWVAGGLDEKLEAITWTRFATGLYHPMGLKVVDGKVCVRCRDMLVRLNDLNADGEADYYENLSDEGFAHPSYHGFVFDLQADRQGNFYYARGGIGMDPAHAGHGRLTRLSADFKHADAIATGLRAPNGIGLLANRWISVSDNQGNWIPSSRISLVDARLVPQVDEVPFLGFLPAHHQSGGMPNAAGERPLVWIPHKLDNSSGGQCEIPANAWGPYGGQWIHTSFGAACVMLLLPDAATPAGQMPKQAAVVRLPLDFATGVMRPRFNPKDGQLYVAGVGGGWQTKGTADGGLYRVRQTGKPGFAPTSFAVVPGGVRLTFAQPLDKTEAADVQNYGVEQWNYKWTEKYGSPDFSAKTPDKAGHDEVEVRSAKVSEDGRSVTLTLGDLRQVDQLLIDVHLKTAAGAEFQQAVYATVNAVPK